MKNPKIKRILKISLSFIFLLLGLFASVLIFASKNLDNKTLVVFCVLVVFSFTVYGYWKFANNTIKLVKNKKNEKTKNK